ncbi:MAG TPA: TIGR02530 family flagellar biosynthesis protein [Fimbriimonadaceae bacterium]|nr:TIGR02530 family flagellar biosynthesis protein [Fimbriimonadaceae bacterium]
MTNSIQNTKIAELAGQATNSVGLGRNAQPGGFDSILADRLKLSGHAQTRLASRNIELGKEEWERVLGGVDKAAEKGSKESLVMIDDIALVVSVRNRTVITAMDRENLRNNVFTNIDSAVIV